MAILKSGDFEVKVSFLKYEYGWVYYQYEYLNKGKSVFDYKVYPKECLVAEEYRADSLIPTLKEAEDKNKNDYWRTDEPYLTIEIRFFPKLGWIETESNPNVIFTSEDEKARLKQVDKLREQSGGKLQDDCFEITFLIGQPMSGSGPAFVITITRKDLKVFIAELEKEYKIFEKNNKDEIRASFEQAGLEPPL